MSAQQAKKRVASPAEASLQVAVPNPPKKPKLDVTGETSNVNTDFRNRVARAYGTIVDHEAFEGIIEQLPLEIQSGEGERSGHQAPFDQELYKVSMAETGRYKCAGNMMWLSMQWSPMPNVHLRHVAIPMLKDHYFKRPCVFLGRL